MATQLRYRGFCDTHDNRFCDSIPEHRETGEDGEREQRHRQRPGHAGGDAESDDNGGNDGPDDGNSRGQAAPGLRPRPLAPGPVILPPPPPSPEVITAPPTLITPLPETAATPEPPETVTETAIVTVEPPQPTVDTVLPPPDASLASLPPNSDLAPASAKAASNAPAVVVTTMTSVMTSVEVVTSTSSLTIMTISATNTQPIDSIMSPPTAAPIIVSSPASMNAESVKSSPAISAGAFAGIAVGVLVLFVAAMVGVYCCFRRRRATKIREDSEVAENRNRGGLADTAWNHMAGSMVDLPDTPGMERVLGIAAPLSIRRVGPSVRSYDVSSKKSIRNLSQPRTSRRQSTEGPSQAQDPFNDPAHVVQDFGSRERLDVFPKSGPALLSNSSEASEA